MTNSGVKCLAAAVVLQATKDYFSRQTTDEKRKVILKQLRSDWMEVFTDGTSIVVAERLEKYPEEIKSRLKAQKKLELLNKSKV
jgi:hypothetical protein